MYIGERNIINAYVGDRQVQSICVGDKETDFNLDSQNYIENGLVRKYLNNTDYANDPLYTYSDVANYSYKPATYIKDYPHPYYIFFEVQTNNCTLYLSDGVNTYTFNVPSNTNRYAIYNLLPNVQYTWSLRDILDNEIASGTAQQTGYNRMIYIEGVRNVRDIGGWNCDGGRVAYGKIYRGTEVTGGYGSLTPEGLHMFKDVLSIDAELDIDENVGEAYPGIDYYHYSITAYETGLASTQSEIASCIHTIASCLNNNEVIYTHCAAGCDRTGTIVLLIEGLLGVNDSDKSKDYELSSFFMSYYGYDRLRTTTPNGYKGMIDYLNSYSGATLNDKIKSYCLAIGVTQSDINIIKSKLID